MPRSKTKATSPAKKTAPKKAVKPVSTVKVEESKMPESAKGLKVPTKFEVKMDKKKALKALLYTVLFVVGFGLIDLLVQYLNNDYSVAVVNGQRITMSEFNDRIAKAYGTTAASALIDEVLIEQAGVENKVVVTQKDIDNRMKEIAEQIGGEKALEDTLKANNIEREDIERQIRIEMVTAEILEPTIKYEEKDVKTFFDTYKSQLYPGQDSVKFEDKKSEVEESFLAQKVEEAKTAWLEGLRTKAKVQNNITTKPEYGFFKTITNIVSNMVSEVKNTK
ncbi:MAG TPA: hypothetical protein PLV59_02565 [Candidatus Dojkabacteria bacterium]|nr:hypothetical protein [Candidatus Dojkabacteria bacterium]